MYIISISVHKEYVYKVYMVEHREKKNKSATGWVISPPLSCTQLWGSFFESDKGQWGQWVGLKIDGSMTGRDCHFPSCLRHCRTFEDRPLDLRAPI